MSYITNEIIDITVTFDESVIVEGTPQLSLETGDDDATANYARGSGGTEIVFQYTVLAEHNSDDLNYFDTGSLTLNGGTITATDDDADAVLTLPAVSSDSSLAGTSAVIVDAVAPEFASATTINPFDVEIVFDEPVTGDLATTQFTVSNNLVIQALILNSNIQLTVTPGISGKSQTVSYDGNGSITDAAGNPVAAFSRLINQRHKGYYATQRNHNIWHR